MTSLQADKVELAELIAKALKTSQQQSPSSIKLFIEKMYKKSLGDQNKINQIRLVRFNSLLCKVYKEFSQLNSVDIQVIFLTIYCFLNKVGMFLQDRSIYSTYVERSNLLAITFHWTAKLVQTSANSKLGVEMAIETLNWFLTANKKTVPKLQEFVQLTQKSVYFKKIILGLEEQSQAAQLENQQLIVVERELFQNVLVHIDVRKVIRGIVTNCTDLKQSFEMFVLLSRSEYMTQPRFKMFQQYFIDNIKQEQRLTPKYLQVLKLSLQKLSFEYKNVLTIEQLIAQTKTEMREKLNMNEDGSQIMIVEKDNNVCEVIDIENVIRQFATSQKPTFKQLCDIIRQRDKISRAVLDYLFENQKLNNSKGILIALFIAQTKKITPAEFLKFCQGFEHPNEAKKNELLFLLHFAFQQPPLQCQLVNSIIANIKQDQLANHCTFSFLPHGNLQKIKINKQQKTQIQQLSTTNTYSSQHLFKVKMDLAALSGQNVPFFHTIDKIMAITSRSVQEMIESLATEKNQQIVEVVLMRINYMMKRKYISNVNQKTLEWIAKSYQTYYNRFVKSTKQYLKSSSKLPNPQLGISLKLYNLCKQTNQQIYDFIVPQYQSFFTQDPLLKLKGEQYSNYVIHVQTKQDPQTQSKRYWNHLVQIMKFIRSIDQKNYAKKDIKKIMQKYKYPTIYVVQGLHYCMKNNIAHKDLISKMIILLEEDYETLESLAKKAVELDLQFFEVDYLLDYMLSISYEDTVNFISGLLRSHKLVKEQKPQKKKKGREPKKKNEDNHVNKILTNLLSCLQILLNQPDRLKDISKVTEIVERLIHFVSAQQENDLMTWIGCWMSQFSTLTFNSYDQMSTKVKSLREFYLKVYDFMKGALKNKQIQEQFSIFSNILIKSKIYNNQQSYKVLEHQILSNLHLIFTLQNLKSDNSHRNIEVERIYSIFDNYKKKTQQVYYFFCEDCQKSVCEGCYTFLHRNHDVNFLSKDKGICVHEINDKPQRQKPVIENNINLERVRKPERFVSRYMHGQELEQILRFQNNDLNFERAAFMSRLSREKKDRFLQRALERGVDLNISSPFQERDFRDFEFNEGRRAELGISRNLFQPQNIIEHIQPVRSLLLPMPTSFVPPPIRFQPPALPLKQVIQPPVLEEQTDNFIEIKSQTEKQIVQINTRQNFNIQRPVFECQSRYAEHCPANNINMTLLLKQLVAQLPKTKLVGADDAEDGLVHVLEKYNFEMNPTFTTELGQQKYIITRMNVSKFGGRYDLMDHDERSDRKYKMYSTSRLLIANNLKYLAISLGPTVTFMQVSNLKKSFKKRQKVKRYNEADSEDTYRVGKKMDVPFQIIDMAFSALMPHYLCVLGSNQMNIVNISSTNRQFKKLVFKFPTETDSAVRFSWLPAQSNKILIQIGTQVKLFEFKQEDNTVNPQLTLLKRIGVGKAVQSFKVRLNTVNKIYTCFVTDLEGTFYSYSFSLGNDQIEQTKLNVPQTKEPLNSFTISQKSNMGFASYKDGSNVLLKLPDNKKVQSINLKFFKYFTPTHQSFNIIERYGNTMTNVKQIYSSKDCVIVGCILRKQLNNNVTAGNLAIIQISNQSSVHLTIMNDANKTQNFELFNYEDDTKQKFIIIAVQSDGCVWMKSYEPRKQINKLSTIDVIPEQKYQSYHKNLHYYLKFQCGENRIVDFKQHTKLQTIDATVNPVQQDIEITSRIPYYITGVTFKVEAIGKIKFKVLDTTFQFNIKKARQIQLPLTIKQSITTFIQKKLKVQIIYTKPLSTLVEAYGHPYDRPSIVKEIYRELIQLWVFNNNFSPKNIQHYFNDSNRLDFHNVNLDQLNTTLKQASFDLNQVNFVLKLELLTQAVEQNSEQLDSKVLEEFIDKSKKYMWVEKSYIGVSIQRMYKKIFEAYKKVAGDEGKSVVYGDAYDYHTFKDTITVEHQYKQFLLTTSHTTFDQLLQTLTKMRIRRIFNLYLMFTLFPSLIWTLTNYFAIELQRSTSDSNKRKTGDRLVSMIIVICEYFEYLKNQKKPAEVDTFKLLELLLSGISKNKELFKELIMRSFEYLETVPLMKQIEISYGCSLFEIKSVVPEAFVMMEQEQYQMRLSDPKMQEEKQSEEDEAEMRIDQDYQELVEQTERKSSVQLFANQADKEVVVGECWKILIENRKTVQLKFCYYDIVYYLTTGLFQHQIVRPETNNFYIGMFYNLLNLLDVRIFRYQTKSRMMESFVEPFLESVNKQLDNKESSALFLVLAHFLEPDYSKLRSQKQQQTPRIRDLIIEYYSRNYYKLPFKELFETRISSQVQKTFKLKEALSSNGITCASLIYQLKYLGNLYLCIFSSKVNTNLLDRSIKEFILKIYVKKKLRVYKNILILQGWVEDINLAKYHVGFDDIKHRDVKNGLDKIIEGIKEKPETLVSYLREQPDKLDQLESLLYEDIQESEKSRVIQVIGEYYKGI